MPDAQFYREGNDAPRAQDEGLARGRPDLVVEIASPSSQRYDRVKKLRWYAELGVPEYWLIDPTARTVERLVLLDRAYVIAESLADDETFAPKSFNGLSLPWQSSGRIRPSGERTRPAHSRGEMRAYCPKNTASPIFVEAQMSMMPSVLRWPTVICRPTPNSVSTRWGSKCALPAAGGFASRTSFKT
jgi:Putative restriction endonuclease